MQNIEATTGISTSKYRRSLERGNLLPHNWDGAEIKNYQLEITEENQYFYYSTAVLKPLKRFHPSIANRVIENYDYNERALARLTLESGIAVATDYAVANSVSARFHEATNLYLWSGGIASIAIQYTTLSGQEKYNNYKKQAARLGIYPDFSIQEDVSKYIEILEKNGLIKIV